MSHFFTSESVTEGHPDKICDQISDAILDEALKQDPHAHVACECLVTTGLVIVAGEMRTKGYIDIAGIARRTIRDIGYDDAMYGFDHGMWMFGGWLTMLLIWVAPILLLFFGLRNYFGNRLPTARELLDQAYARGELSRDEYLRKRDDLAGR